MTEPVATILDPFTVAGVGVVLAFIGGFVGSAIGILRAANAGLSVLAEDPGSFKWVMLLSSLPMTQTFYGFIYTLLGFTSVLPSVSETLTMAKAAAIFTVSVAVMLAEMFSAVYQGSVCMSGILELVKTKGRIATSTMILASYEELFGILGMVLGYLIVTIIAALPI